MAFTFTENTQDLFTVSKDYVLVHCISADFALGAGIAKIFRDKGVRAELLSKYETSVPGTALLTTATGWAGEINLVTKALYWHKPTYNSLRTALLRAKHNIIIPNGYTKLAMPRIGCGLDKLLWARVKAILCEIFADTDIEIIVCKL